MECDRVRQTTLGPEEIFEKLSKQYLTAYGLSKVIVPKDGCFS